MDPASAVGVASSVLAFAEFSYKFASAVYTIMKDKDCNDGTKSLQATCAEMKRLSGDLKFQPVHTPVEEAVRTLANECFTLSDRILKKMAKMEPKRRNVFYSAKAALKTVCSKNELSRLQSNLDSCRSQLQMAMSQVQGDSTAAALQRLEDASDAHEERLESYREKANLSVILDALSFPGMNSRHGDVSTAIRDTFSWIYNGSSSPHDFTNWLESGSGIFHISGKPGSGKSTLMKFIVEHKETWPALQAWAGEKSLVLGNCFFWKPGQPLQRNRIGLLRSLLHGILRSCRELALDLLPEFWDPDSYDDYGPRPQLTIDDRLVTEAFSRLVLHKELYEHHRYCFFIDGLDEFDDDTETSSEFVDTLMTWTEMSGGNLKLCVSSRELPVFQNRLLPQHRIRLQDLTEKDIEILVNQKLGAEKAACSPGYMSETDWCDLKRRITDRADGVFLWVSLTLNLVCEALQSRESPAQIALTVDSLPTALSAFFRRILDQIPKSQRTLATATFLYTMECGSHTVGQWYGRCDANNACFDTSSLLWFSFLDDYVENRRFLDDTAKQGQLCTISQESLKQRLLSVQTRIPGRCRGLLEVSTTIQVDNDWPATDIAPNDTFPTGSEFPNHLLAMGVKCIHRSIVEFLHEHLFQLWAPNVAEFDLTDAYLHVAIAVLSSIPMNTSTLDGRRYMFHLTSKVTSLMYNPKVDDRRVYFNLMDILDRLLYMRQVAVATDFPVERRKKYKSSNISVGSFHRLRHLRQFETIPLAAAATLDHEYLAYKIQQDPGLLSNNEGTHLLHAAVSALLENQSRKQCRTAEDATSTLKFLLERGVSPNSLVYGGFCKLSPWQTLYYLTSIRAYGLPWLAVELFLIYGAPIPIWRRFPLDLDIDGSYLAYILIGLDFVRVCLIDLEQYPGSIGPGGSIDPRWKDEMTLADFVELQRPKNAEGILAILAQRQKEQEEVLKRARTLEVKTLHRKINNIFECRNSDERVGYTVHFDVCQDGDQLRIVDPVKPRKIFKTASGSRTVQSRTY